MATKTVPIHFVHRVLRVAERLGFDAVPLLRAAGIPGDVATSPRARVTVAQATRLTRKLWQQTGDELIGLGPPVPRGTFQLIGLVLIHAPDLREVGVRIDDATRLLPGVPRFRTLPGDTTSRLEIDVAILDDPEHLGTELLLTLAHRLMGWLIGRRIPLRSVELPYPEPPYAEDYHLIFGCMPAFDTSTAAITFDTALLDAPVIRDEADLGRYIDKAPGDLYRTRDYGSTTADQVRKILEHGLSGDWPTADEIAARLAVSPQHLRRLLREQHTSVTEIKDDLLRDAAIASLVAGRESVGDLAARLGFSEASAFRRAFRRWTGSPPGTYRPA